MTPSQLTDLIVATSPEGGIDERPDALSFRARLADNQLRAQWLALRAQPPEFIERIRVDVADADEPLETYRVPSDHETFQIRVAKVETRNELRLFFGAAIAELDTADLDVDHIRIANLAVDGAFGTYRSRAQTWTADPVAPYPASEPLPDPRTFASDFTQREAVPADIRPWLIRSRPRVASDAYAAWVRLSTRRLLASLADQVSYEAGQQRYAFTGPPACKIEIADDRLDQYFERASAGALWVFAEGLRDADTRHLLLANEWARTFRRHGHDELGEGSLESAKGAYQAYVKAGSRETLKSLAELRKTVVDETQKISQRAQDLIGAIWKDVAVAFAPFVVKILPDAAKAENRWIGSAMAAAAAAYLIFSYIMQVYINAAWFRQQGQARTVWQSELNLVLSKSEVETYSKTPIDQSLGSYRCVRNWVGFFYAVVIIILSWFALANLPSKERTPAVRATPQGPAPEKVSQLKGVPAKKNPPKQSTPSYTRAPERSAP